MQCVSYIILFPSSTVVVPIYSFPELTGKNDVLSLREGSNHQMSFTVTCNPPLDATEQHHLYKEKDSVSTGRVYVEAGAVHFRRVRRSDAGKYFISSTNAAGYGQSSFSLCIKCES